MSFLEDTDMFAGALAGAADAFAAPPNPYVKDPVGWIEEKCGEHPWSIQAQILESIRDNRYTVVPSCHDSGKSWLASRAMAWWGDVHPLGEAFIVSTAPTTHQVDAILWRELRRAHAMAGLPGRITLDSKWRVDAVSTDELIGYGRKPQDYNPDAFQGIHQRYVLIIIDEANAVPKVLFDAVDTLATNANARVLAIGNPDNPASHFAHICKPGSGWNQIQISAFDTPNFTGEYVPQAVREQLLSPEWVEERKKRWGIRSPLYVSKVLGQFPKMSGDALIQPDWIEEAQKRNINYDKKNYGTLGADIARYGDDETVVVRNRDGHCRVEMTSHLMPTTETAGHLKLAIMRVPPDAAPDINPLDQATGVVDEVGVGGGVVDILHEQNVSIVPFNGGWAAEDSDHFFNARAEAFWQMREEFEKGAMDIDPDDMDLAAELGNLKWSVDSKGRIKMETKDEYRDRTKASSPNRADALCYATLRRAYVPDVASHRMGGTITGDLLARPM